MRACRSSEIRHCKRAYPEVRTRYRVPFQICHGKFGRARKAEPQSACELFRLPPRFLSMDHEKLDVYRISLEVVRSVGLPLKQSAAFRLIRDQILRSSTSILLI